MTSSSGHQRSGQSHGSDGEGGETHGEGLYDGLEEVKHDSGKGDIGWFENAGTRVYIRKEEGKVKTVGWQ